ncbi:MAG: hypothetical protein PSV36_14600 [Algoriphagus sp.]|nr:hypothetical protein [Algoriphagus sp.]
MKNSPAEYLEGKDFSLVLGGPFFQLLKRLHLTGTGLELVKLRIIVISLVAWLPLLLLSMLNGQAWGDGLNLPFFEDIDVHIRFLLAVPIMIVAELLVHERISIVVKEFQERNLIPESEISKFHNAIASALRLRNSFIAEISIVVLIYGIGYQLVWNQTAGLDSSAWYSEQALGKGNLSLAGIWFRYLSLPIFQFLFLRWYYRIFIWARFLYQVSKIKLRLVPTHPDDVGGLGFMANSIFAFMPLAFAHGTLMAGMISNHIFHDGATLLDFKVLIIVVVVIVICLFILPLFVFSSQLSEAKRRGSMEYGKFASRFVQEFDEKWLKGKKPSDNSLMGNDIQSLADLAQSFNVVEKMQFVPISKSNVIMLVAVTIIPVLPLVLTMMPISELVKLLSGLLM